MENTDANRKFVNRQQTQLRNTLTSYETHEEAIELFLFHHAMLHSAEMAQMGVWSFEDAILNDISEILIRRIPLNLKHSAAWCIWHIARIEDIAMNMVVAGTPQVFSEGNWQKKMNVTFQDAGNDMTGDEMQVLSTTIDIDALRAYRVAVGRRTRQIVQEFNPADLKKQSDPERIQRVLDEGALAEKSRGIAEYWSKRDITGLLLMPASRHQIVHLNEALKLIRRRQ